VRCAWARTELGIAYHDAEWGVPVHDDRTLFEFLTLEGAQAGLSWETILRKREAYREAFAGFDPSRVARFTQARLDRLLDNPGIVRNRLKVLSTVTNARAFLEIEEKQSFSDYLWNFVDGRPVQNRFRSRERLPAATPLAEKIAKDLKARGFRFCGPTIVYAFMQATGMVNDHMTRCYRHDAVAKLAR